MPKIITITGKVVGIKHGRGIEGLLIEAWDKDFASKHIVGKDITDENGVFKITFNQREFAAMFKDKNPDIYFKVFKDDRLLASTEREVYWNLQKPRLDDIVIKVYDEESEQKKKITFSGYVYHVGSNPISKIKVGLYAKRGSVENLIESSLTDSRGSYTIELDVGRVNPTKKTVVLVLKVLDNEDKVIAVSNMIEQLTQDNKTNFIIDNKQYMGNSMFKTVSNSISKYVNLKQLSSLNDTGIRQEFTYIAKRSKVKLKEIENYVSAIKLADALDIDEEVTYAFIKYGIAASVEAIVSLNTSEMAKILIEAIQKNIITIERDQIPSIIDKIKSAYVNKLILDDTDEESILGLFKLAIPNEEQCTQILKTYLTYDGSKKHLWDTIDKKEGNRNNRNKTTQKIQIALKLGALTGGYIPVAKALFEQLDKSKENNLKMFASWDKQSFTGVIEKLSETNQKLCVPSFIEGEDDNTRISNYASKMSEIISKAYPTECFKEKVLKKTNDDSPYINLRKDIKRFFDNNPSYKLGAGSLVKIESEDINLRGIKEKKATIGTINAANRLYKLTSDFDGVATLIHDGIDSSISIIDMNKDIFVQKYSGTFGTKERAEEVYHKAEINFVSSLSLLLKVHPNYINDIEAIPDFIELLENENAQAEWRTLFGSIEKAEVEECRTIHSPGAYLTDILRFLETSNEEAFDELTRRRPDLLDIELDCINTSTPLPYIDLVIELLERLTVNNEITVDMNDSYQTNLSADELMAYPEHTIPEAYNILKEQVYPFNLPFDLSLNEMREYLSLTGLERAKIMRDFIPMSTESITSDSLEYLWACEYLGLSPSETTIIVGEDVQDSRSHPWLLFGFDAENKFSPIIDPSDTSLVLHGNWLDNIQRVDVFIKQAGCTYIDLLNLLDTHYINPFTTSDNRLISITSIDSDDMPDTAVLNRLKITGMSDEILIRISNFIRLEKRTGLTHHELDIILTGLELDLDTVENKYESIITLAHLVYLIKNYNLTTEEAVAYFALINTKQYRKNENFNAHEGKNQTYITPLFIKLFNNRNITGTEHSEVLELSDATKSIVLDENITQVIASGLSISVESLNNYLSLLGYSDNTLNLERLSNIYRHIKFSTLINITFQELVELKVMMDQNPFSDPKIMVKFITKYHNLLNYDLSIKDIKNIFFEGETTHKDVNVEEYINKLKKKLIDTIKQKMESNSSTEATLEQALIEHKEELRILLVKELADKFSINELLTKEILDNVENVDVTETNGKYIMDVLLSENFLFSDKRIVYANLALDEDKEAMPDVYQAYGRMVRCVSLTQKFKINGKEIPQLIQYAKTLEGTEKFLDLSMLSIEQVPLIEIEKFKQLEHFTNLIISRDLMYTENYIDTYVGSYGLSYDQWVSTMSEVIGISETEIKGLSTLIEAEYPQDYLDGTIVERLKYCNHDCDLISIKAENINTLLNKYPTIDDAKFIMNTVKSKFNEDEWYEVAGQTRNIIRDRQREALAAFVLSHPDRASKQYWRSYNELFEYLLLDVEVTSKVMTSRLKQAISSVQLVIDRILLGQERKNLDSSNTPFALSEADTEEWKKWRKIYRVWEANRKILLYPENWIEPGLRDNKSPFFKQLESELNQNELSTEAIESTFFNYLDRLDSVSRLDIKDVYREVDTEKDINIIHVLGRTQSTPYKYFYRTRTDGVWDYWNPVNLDISGEQTALVVWNRRVFLIWYEIIEEPEITNVEIPPLTSEDKGVIQRARKRFKIQLSWSQFWQKRWNEKRISRAAVYTEYLTDTELEKVRDSLYLSIRTSEKYMDINPLYATDFKEVDGLSNNILKNGLISLGQYFRFDDCISDPTVLLCNKDRVHIVMPTENVKDMQYIGENALKKDTGYEYQIII